MAEELRIRGLVEQAGAMMRAGRPDDAGRLWHEVLAASPEHPQALFHLGQQALMGKDYARARSLLEKAAAAAPKEPAIPLNLAFVHRATGEAASEMAALGAALAIDPWFYPALLAKGLAVERSGNKRGAAKIYKDVLRIAPPPEQVPPELKEKLTHARMVVEENAAALAAEIAKRTAAVRARHAGEDLARYEECEAVQLGRKKIYTQAPSLLHFPRLPALGFYPRDMFPWLPALEASAGTIRDELLTVLREDTAAMRPYVSHPAGAPVGDWAELNHSPRWSAFFLWEHGKKFAAQCARCPGTAALLDTIPMMDCADYAPTVLFSILDAHTHIPPHSSVTNARLVVHLPLIVPGKCRFRVGNETRDWKYGEAWVFDDTLEHEAWNDSDSVRVIMMIDIWNPLLSQAERNLVSVLLKTEKEWYR